MRIGGGFYWGGGVYVGGFAQPPPPPPAPVYDCDHDPVPVYYTSRPRPAPPRPVAVVSQPAPAPAPLPRLGIGVFAGSVNVKDGMAGEDLGVLGRLRLTDSLLLEAEMAKSQMADARADRRLGGALLYDFSPRSKWSANLSAGLGVTQIDMDAGTGSWQTKQEYGELGVGLTWRLSRRFHLSGDLRAGARARVEDEPDDQMLKSIAPSADQEETYTRGRLSAVLYF